MQHLIGLEALRQEFFQISEFQQYVAGFWKFSCKWNLPIQLHIQSQDSL